MKAKTLSTVVSFSSLRTTDCQAIAGVLNPLVATAFALYVKTKNFHWHMSGSHFRDYHLLLDEQADQIFEMIDVLAERVRKLDERTIQSISQIHQLQTISDDNGVLDAQQMLQHLLEDNRSFTVEMRKAHRVCADKEDVATTSLLENYIDETERRVWFLFETLAK